MTSLTNQLTRAVSSGQGVAVLSPIIESTKWVDIAQATIEMGQKDFQSLVDLLTSSCLSSLMADADKETRQRLADSLTDYQLLVVLGRMQPDDAADVLGALEPRRIGEVLSQMREADRLVLADLLRYPDETAGSIMTTSFLSVREDGSVADCLATLQAKGSKIEQIQTAYVTRADGTLVGYLDLRKILSSARDASVTSIMKTNIISVGPYDDREEAARLVARYDLNALPVVGAGRLLGVITVDDIIDVIIDEYDEDMLRLAGASREETLSSSLMTTVRMRLPWLLVNLLTAFLASLVVRVFEGTIEQVVALSAIMTIVSGMGGNAGSQTMAIVVRHLSREGLSAGELWKALRKEASAGVVDGLVNGLVTGIAVTAIYGNPWLAVVVLAAMTGNMVIAGVSGLLVPVALRRCGQDPAVSSSIFVTTATDVLGFLFFLGLAQAMLPLLTG